MDEKKKERIIPFAIGVVFIFLLSALLFYSPKFLEKSLSALESLSYDLMVRYEHRPVAKDIPIVIVDLDDRSLDEQGRWPWSRKKMARLISSLYGLGARVIALDIMFPEPEENVADEIIRDLKQNHKENPAVLTGLEEVRNSFDYDAIFAKSLAEGKSVLGFVFRDEGKPVGELPAPLLVLTSAMEEWIQIPNMESYLSNIPLLQAAAKSGGFINSAIDQDGVVRFTPMLYRYGPKVFPSLSLAAARLFLGDPELKIVGAEYGVGDVIEGVQLGTIYIPTDPWGRSLVPFRGPPYSIPYVSATDVLKGTISNEMVQNKLVFIGSSATALGDLVATSIYPVFAGVEVHAQTASGILDGYLPYKPAWGKGASIGLILVLGLILAAALPFLGPVFSSVLTFLMIFFLIVFNHYVWKKYGIAMSVIFPIFSLFVIYILNGVCGYIFESNRRKEMKSVFGQYVPPECIDSMMEKSGDYGLEGETKDLSVLFADIRGFTSISEGMSATDLKKLLNEYLSPMTEVIFEKKGTIDKYVGDMIIAFWGAPLNDPQHAEHAVLAALEMQKKLDALNQNFHKNKLPEIHIGVGINSGAMNVGDMGSKFRKAYTVLGDEVNLGSRLESLTKYYRVKILVGEKTFNQTESLFVYRLIDRVRVKGKRNGVNIYEPVAVKGEASPDLLSSLEVHKQALGAYSSRKWNDAEILFKKMKELDSNQELYDLYLARIAEFQKVPPPEDWDGTFTIESK